MNFIPINAISAFSLLSADLPLIYLNQFLRNVLNNLLVVEATN